MRSWAPENNSISYNWCSIWCFKLRSQGSYYIYSRAIVVHKTFLPHKKKHKFNGTFFAFTYYFGQVLSSEQISCCLFTILGFSKPDVKCDKSLSS